MFNFKEFFQKVKVEKKLSKKDLKTFLSTIILTTSETGSEEYSGYSIKNSIESFLNYISDVVYGERSAFYVSKKDLNEVLSEMGVKIENLPSGAYENEVFKVLNLDVQHFNRKIVQFLGEICSDHEPIKELEFLNEIKKDKVSLYDLYLSKSPTLESRNQAICEVFSTINAHNLANLTSSEDDVLLFSFYKPSSLYESWYIGSIFINKGSLLNASK